MSSTYDDDADALEILRELVALHHRDGGVTCSDPDCTDLWCRAARLGCAHTTPGSAKDGER